MHDTPVHTVLLYTFTYIQTSAGLILNQLSSNVFQLIPWAIVHDLVREFLVALPVPVSGMGIDSARGGVGYFGGGYDT